MPGSELPEELSTDDKFEVPAAVDPPVYEDLGADSGHRDDALVGGVAMCSGRKHCVYDTQAACDCGEPVTEAQRTDSESAVRCTKMGCETEWYHRECFEVEQFGKSWMCPSCSSAKRHRRAA
ncbi:hypothetical protein B0H13DRAFT_1868504 [Mycena leptocephala]|nr:hypothetical protein B0H13DRAFT_1868504 [Mycena leptocephala]